MHQITSDKKLKICTGSMDPIFYFGDLTNSSLVDLWENSNDNIMFYRSEKASDISQCKKCIRSNICSFRDCRVLSYYLSGDIIKPNPIICHSEIVS